MILPKFYFFLMKCFSLTQLSITWRVSIQSGPFLIITSVVLSQHWSFLVLPETINWVFCFFPCSNIVQTFSALWNYLTNHYKWLVNRSRSQGFSPACLARLLQILVGPFFLDEICQMQVKLVLLHSQHCCSAFIKTDVREQLNFY